MCGGLQRRGTRDIEEEGRDEEEEGVDGDREGDWLMSEGSGGGEWREEGGGVEGQLTFLPVAEETECGGTVVIETGTEEGSR